MDDRLKEASWIWLTILMSKTNGLLACKWTWQGQLSLQVLAIITFITYVKTQNLTDGAQPLKFNFTAQGMWVTI